MRGYPKRVATKQDFLNLLDSPYKNRALAELQSIVDLDDDTATRATGLIDENDPEKGYKTEAIPNPLPAWKRYGFGSRQEIADLIAANQ